MSKENDTVSVFIVLGMIAAIIGYAVIAMAIVAAALLSFGAFVLSIIALFAWNNPIRLGKITIEPDDARTFIIRGLIGAASLPAFVVVAFWLLDARIPWAYMHFIAIAGYVAFSIGIEILLASDEGQAFTQSHYVAPPQQIAPPSRPALPSPAKPPFQFASWDDEEDAA